MAYPDYGQPGAPNMDPYYVSPEQERRRETERAESIAGTIAAYSDDLHGLLSDLKASLAKDGAELTSIVVDVANLRADIGIKL